MAELATGVFDLLTLLGPASSGVETLSALLARHNVAGAAALSTQAVFFDALCGNAQTRAECAGSTALLPAAVLDPRVPNAAEHAEGARLVCLFPATQNWPLTFAPLAGALRALSAGVVLWADVARLGDATTLSALLRDAGYAGPVVLGGVTGAALVEALAATGALPGPSALSTDGMHGVGEVGLAVRELGPERVVFASRAPAQSLGAGLALVRQAGLPVADEARVLGGNARRLLGLPL